MRALAGHGGGALVPGVDGGVRDQRTRDRVRRPEDGDKPGNEKAYARSGVHQTRVAA